MNRTLTSAWTLSLAALLAGLFADLPEAVANTEFIAEKCDLKLQFGRVQLPDFPIPEGYTPDTYLEKLCREGLRRRYTQITPEVEERLRPMGRRPLRREGIDDATWALLDVGDIVVHMFDEETRRYYDLERLWVDAPRLEYPVIFLKAASSVIGSGDTIYLPRLSRQIFYEAELAVVIGDAQTGKAFTELPFDHLFFTGSTAVGRMVAQAAAKNLTPVTLELGGKSPAILDPSSDFATAAPRLAFGKLPNAGQTCIAPDYAFVPTDRIDSFVEHMQRAVAAMYPSLAANADYTSIVSDRHFARLQGLLEDARSKGARMVTVNPASETFDPARRKRAPVLVLGATPEMKLMPEEIFGPILPVLAYDRIEETIAYINRHDRRLALYWFGTDGTSRDKVLSQTMSGGVTLNDCIWHIAQEDQPFGGVGASGSGSYHGEWGFRTFSKEKPVFAQSRFNGMFLMYPPYGKTIERMLALLKRIA